MEQKTDGAGLEREGGFSCPHTLLKNTFFCPPKSMLGMFVTLVYLHQRTTTTLHPSPTCLFTYSRHKNSVLDFSSPAAGIYQYVHLSLKQAP
jgi:hypothetical protein